MGERDFAGKRLSTTAKHGAEASRMMRSAKRALRDSLRSLTDERMDLSDFYAFLEAHVGQERRNAFGEHGFAGAGRAV